MEPTFNDEKSLFNFVVRDGNGVKGLVDLGVTKVPKRYVQPPKERIEKTNNNNNNPTLPPPIDLSKLDGPDREEAAEEIFRAAESVGFFQVVNHGVPLELLESLKKAAFRFFEQEAEKKAVFLKGVSPSPHVKYGTSFVPEKEVALEEVSLEYLKTSINMVKKILEVLITKLGIMSNGRYKSAEHRVRTTSKESRVSVPIFTIPKPNQKIGPLAQAVDRDGSPRYREVLFQHYMANFFGNAHDGKNSLQFAHIH
ncbi:hypothetical protein G4B88_026217 [Cannabis sativa]|uniref:Non-haem dioxygenase N-terminal domain-containing protein n=1 Tax=Cannabis sativa TaxID=3483 RepID=A0A7J6EWC7_CANSA|nr:hypothetical protein G4B88_026217 [Cannabis sativa]